MVTKMSKNENHHSFSRVALRFLFRIFFGIVLCIVMYGTFFSFFNAEWYQRVLSGLVFILFVYMLYTGMWSAGVHDKDEIYFQRMKRNPLKGLAASAVVSIPYAILNAILLFNCYNVFSVYNTALQNSEKLVEYLQKYSTIRLIFNLINSPFLFITLNYEYSNVGKTLIGTILLPLTIIAIGGASYYLGLKNISIFQLSFYKDEKKDQKNRNK